MPTTPTAHAAASMERLRVWSASMKWAKGASFMRSAERIELRCTSGPSWLGLGFGLGFGLGLRVKG